MHRLRTLIPSANHLFIFEAAARRLSFTHAAQELNVTQPAVSRAIKLLEERLGVRLFHRSTPRLALTAQGQHFAAEVQKALDHLGDVASALGGSGSPAQLRVCFSASFVQFWLLPRLHDFKARYPSITLRIEESSRDDHNLNQEEIDVSARLGDGDWPGIMSWPLFAEEIILVCSPDYLAKAGPLTEVADLLNHSLLDVDEKHRNRVNWQSWLAHFGLSGARIRSQSTFTDILGAIEAAVLHQGIALGWRHIVDKHLQAGRLVMPLPEEFRTAKHIRITMPGLRPRRPEAEIFRDWLLEQAGQPLP